MTIDFLKSKVWRMNHLYRVVTKDGDSVAFKLNSVQADVLANLHTRNLILKARQLGMSTFAVLYLLDEVIFNSNFSGGIVSYNLDHAQHIFNRIIGHALDSLLPVAKQLCGIVQRSARAITFANGSMLRVDTTLRGGAYQLVLVSEFGKTCARNPIKAEEVVTGTLQTVSDTGRIIIESTGEGNDGFFAEMVANSAQQQDDLTHLDYKLFFYPWYSDPKYVLQRKIEYPVELTDYFDGLEESITQPQRNWYAKQSTILGDKMKQEFPSTISEAFLSNSEAYYFQMHIEKAYQENRMLAISPYDALERVHVAMDIGVNDLTVMVFFQCVHGEIRVIDFYKDNNKGVDHYCMVLQQQRPYLYHTIFLPHDAKVREKVIVDNTYERDFNRLFQQTDTRIHVLKRTDKNINITNAKLKFDRCVFDLRKTKPLIDMLTKYRKRWSEQYGKYLDEPYHGIESNYADAFLYMAQAVTHIETVSGSKGALAAHKKAVESRYLKF